MDSHTRTPTGQYSIAGVIVRFRTDEASHVAARLAGIDGVEVHHIEAPTGRLVLTLETDRHDHEEAHLERVRREPGVISAELVYHYIEPRGPD